MIAFVLSGGGNRGALQVGALQVLLEAGIRPEMLASRVRARSQDGTP